jgi:integrase
MQSFYPGQPSPKRPLQLLEQTELDALEIALGAIRQDWGVAAKLMGRLGLRVAEVKKLSWRHLKLEGPADSLVMVTGEIAKNGYPRTLPIPNELAIALIDLKLERLKEYEVKQAAAGLPPSRAEFADKAVVTKTNGARPTIRWIQRLVANESRKSIGHRIHPHTLRHTFATRLLQKTNLRVVQDALGHRSITSTQIYTHPTMKDLREAIEKAGGQD